jgi:hypothetical protein
MSAQQLVAALDAARSHEVTDGEPVLVVTFATELVAYHLGLPEGWHTCPRDRFVTACAIRQARAHN